MAAKKQSSRKKGKAAGFILGSARFEKISAVEGIVYSADMKGRAEISKRKGLSPEERRKMIIKAYRKA